MKFSWNINILKVANGRLIDGNKNETILIIQLIQYHYGMKRKERKVQISKFCTERSKVKIRLEQVCVLVY